ncbi:hypothetical protein [Microbacterium oxydans]|uniref:hypothetical protein n=1 Tax=Microbacterium oxydans TaxID=82380 RepID=UPI0024AD441C|nr:hypothetical protein [Microbacterium oxydans]
MNERDAPSGEEYLPPPPPTPAADARDLDAQDSTDDEKRFVVATRRRSRAIIILVIVIAAVLLLGTIATNLLLAAGLRAEIGEGREDIPSASASPEASATPTAAGVTAECGELCAAATAEIGTAAGEWKLEGEWTDTPNDLGSRDAATAVFGSDAGRATLVVLQFPSDEEAAQAAVDLRARVGDPTYTEQVFDDGSGTRYDFDGAIVSRVVWHLDAQSQPHTRGRLYIVEAPANAADSFADQSAYRLYLALPL